MTDTERPESSRRAVYLLLGAVALLLVPVVVGFVMANTGGGGEDESGMGGSDTTRIAANTSPTVADPGTNLALDASVTDVGSRTRQEPTISGREESASRATGPLFGPPFGRCGGRFLVGSRVCGAASPCSSP